jgi:hypothetical protein
MEETFKKAVFSVILAWAVVASILLFSVTKELKNQLEYHREIPPVPSATPIPSAASSCPNTPQEQRAYTQELQRRLNERDEFWRICEKQKDECQSFLKACEEIK